ncbi:MAG: cobalamin biosynthesis protein CobQ [Thermoprotei archaeon]|nr:MAG: cobalamin biosynthesis protein CobQ [Thermoprotei archaeon]RLF18770.1 MAG: cobalamin biosynthesis protein CobQ [Thermoprotei archaeon]
MTFRLAVTGGKGGTGKTVVAVNLAAALSARGFKVLLADGDVDGPCTSILINAKLTESKPVKIFKPLIDRDLCKPCGSCAKVCREHALAFMEGAPPILFEELCSGCKACQIVCSYGAIKEDSKTIGFLHSAQAGPIRLKIGELNPGEARSPIVARELKLEVDEELKRGDYDVMIIDTSPGLHNAVVQALWGVDLALVVTEPTPLGLNDLFLILDLLSQLGIEAWVVLNRADIPGGIREKILEACRLRGIEVAVEVPYDEELFKAYVRGEPLIKSSIHTPARQALMDLASKVEARIKPSS